MSGIIFYKKKLRFYWVFSSSMCAIRSKSRKPFAKNQKKAATELWRAKVPFIDIRKTFDTNMVQQ